MQDDSIDPVAREHMKEQLEAAAEENYLLTSQVHSQIASDKNVEVLKGPDTYVDLINGYLMSEWTWFKAIANDVEKDDSLVPDTCEHVDPLHPAIWVALLNHPNKFWCFDCAQEESDKEETKDACDRCSAYTAKFYDFAIALGNIQLIGSICKSCVDKASSN